LFAINRESRGDDAMSLQQTHHVVDWPGGHFPFAPNLRSDFLDVIVDRIGADRVAR
jgi:hypothetical protein